MNWDYRAFGSSSIELARTPQLLYRVFYHLVPLGNPANRSCNRKQNGKHRRRNAQIPSWRVHAGPPGAAIATAAERHHQYQ